MKVGGRKLLSVLAEKNKTTAEILPPLSSLRKKILSRKGSKTTVLEHWWKLTKVGVRK